MKASWEAGSRVRGAEGERKRRTGWSFGKERSTSAKQGEGEQTSKRRRVENGDTEVTRDAQFVKNIERKGDKKVSLNITYHKHFTQTYNLTFHISRIKVKRSVSVMYNSKAGGNKAQAKEPETPR